MNVTAGCLLAGCIGAAMACAGAPAQQTYSGVYHQGFEQSDFYTLSGDGPYWVTGSESVWDELQAFYQPAPGRGGGVTVKMTVEGQLETDGAFGSLDHYDTQLFVTRIVEIEPLPIEEYWSITAGFRTGEGGQ